MTAKKMNRKVRHIFVAAVWTGVTGLCVFLQGSPNALQQLQKSGVIGPAFDIGIIRDWLAGVAPIAAAVGFFRTADCASKNEVLQEQRASLLRQTKDSFAQALALQLGVQLHNGQIPELSVRIFLPERIHWLSPRALLVKLLHRDELRFGISNVEGLADKHHTEGLSFVVGPSDRAQGLVGSCYNTKQIVLDDDLQNTDKTYNLTVDQAGATCNLVFCVCLPVFKRGDANSKVIAVIALDSSNVLFQNAIHGADERVVKEAMVSVRSYCDYLHEDVPELFC